MKTKLVYVVTSGVDDIYLAQAALSAFSARHFNPDANITLIVDDLTDATITGARALILKYVSEKVVVRLPPSFNNKLRSRQIKTNLRNYIKGDFLFIDTDTIICQSLIECDHFDFNIGAVLDFHVGLPLNPLFDKISKQLKNFNFTISDQDHSYFNSGVFYVKDNEATHKFYSEWHRIWQSQVETGCYTDQQPLAVVNKNCGYVINELPGEWNCQILVNGLPYISEAKIIHFFSSGSSNKLNSSAYIFTDNNIFKDINRKGFIPNHILELAQNGRKAFYRGSNMRIVAGEAYEVVFKSDVVQFVIKQKFRHPPIYKFLQKLVKLYGAFINFKSGHTSF
jgi:hypothetical protein